MDTSCDFIHLDCLLKGLIFSFVTRLVFLMLCLGQPPWVSADVLGLLAAVWTDSETLLSNEVISACSPASPISPCWNLALACIVLL